MEERNSLTLEMYKENNNNGSNTEQQINRLTFKIKGLLIDAVKEILSNFSIVLWQEWYYLGVLASKSI